MYISTRTFIVAVWTSYEMLRRFQGVANNVNKRLFMSPYFTSWAADEIYCILATRARLFLSPTRHDYLMFNAIGSMQRKGMACE